VTGDATRRTDTAREATADDAAAAAIPHVLGLVWAYMGAQTVGAAVRLRVFDLLGDDERTADEVAARGGTDPRATLRLLRCLAALGLLKEVPGEAGSPGGFRTTPAGGLLREDTPGSVRAFVRMFTDPAMVRSWESLDGSVQTGDTAFDTVFGKRFFDHLKEQPELSAQFNAAMSWGSQSVAAALPAHYDFGRFTTVVDVGGGDGTLLAAILQAHTGPRGILYDTAEGLAQAPETLKNADVADRADTVTGDFFTSVPEGGDLYLLKNVVHDWDDDTCVGILRRCRQAMPEHGRLLVLEPVLPDSVGPGAPALAYLSDLNMLVNLGGRERTRDDFTALCHAAGFHTPTVTPLPGQDTYCVIEAAPDHTAAVDG
jgi:hypothetical protein